MNTDPIAIGIWGLGRAGWCMHRAELELYPGLFRIAGGCDWEITRCRKLEQHCPGSRGYQDAVSFLNDSDIEAVAIATRSNDHVAHARMALEAGKYVLLEKPIAVSYADALKLQRWSEEFPGRLFFRHNRRFEPAFQHIREILATGVLGNIYEVKLRRHHFHHREDWQTLRREGGGMLNNWGPHLLDHALQLLESPVTEVWSDLRLVASAGDAEDHFKIILRGANGRMIDVEVSSGIATPSWVYAIYGTRGTLIAPTEAELQLRYLDTEDPLPATPASAATPEQDYDYGKGAELNWCERTIPVAPASGETMQSNYLHLYRAIRENIPYPITVAQAVEVVRITEIVKQNPIREARS